MQSDLCFVNCNTTDGISGHFYMKVTPLQFI